MATKRIVTPGKKRVGIWIRVSTEDQAQGESPQHHEKRARWYAESRDWEVVEVYDLAGVSGKSVIEHPEAKRMMADIQNRRITGLIFSKLARLGRNVRELLDFSAFFEQEGADLISLGESIDTSTPSGRLFYTILAAMANWERDEISSRVRASVVVRAKMGKRLGADAPFGYQWINNQMIPHPEEAPVRRHIHELYLREKRIKTVVRRLAEHGYRNRKGKPFTPGAVRRMIEDTTPKGVRRANYTTMDPTSGKLVIKPEEEWVQYAVQSIVPPEVWDECHALYLSQRPVQKQPPKKVVHLFSGLLTCACGHKMYVPSNTPKYVCQKCRSKIPIETMEALFIEELKNYILSPEKMDAYLLGADKAIAKNLELLDHLQKDKAKVRQEMDRVYRFFMDAEFSQSGFGERYRPLEERLAQLNEEIPKLEAELDVLKVNRVSTDEVLAEAKTFAECWPDLSPETRRHLVEKLMKKIVVGKGEIEFHIKFLPEFLALTEDQEFVPEDPADDFPKTPQAPTPIKSDTSVSSKKMAKGVRSHSLRAP